MKRVCQVLAVLSALAVGLVCFRAKGADYHSFYYTPSYGWSYGYHYSPHQHCYPGRYYTPYYRGYHPYRGRTGCRGHYSYPRYHFEYRGY